MIIGIIIMALVFYVFVPGMFLTLPSGSSSKKTVAIVHGLIFAVVWHFTHAMLFSVARRFGLEAFTTAVPLQKR